MRPTVWLVIAGVAVGGCARTNVRLSRPPREGEGKGGMSQTGVAFQYGQLVVPNQTVAVTSDTILGVSDVGAASSDAEFSLVIGPHNGSNGEGRMVLQDFGPPNGVHTAWETDSGLAILWGPFQYLRGRMYRGGGIASTNLIEVVDATKCRVYFAEGSGGGAALVLTNEAPSSGSPASITLNTLSYVEFEVVNENGTDKLKSSGPVMPPFPATIQGFIDQCMAKKTAAGGGN